MESWQIFHVARKRMSKAKLWEIWRKATPEIEEWCKTTEPKSLQRNIDKWAANPKYCVTTSRNPLDRIRLFLDELDSIGEGEYARAAIDYMAAPIGGCFAYRDKAESDKGTVDGEAADIMVAVGNLIETTRKALPDGFDENERSMVIEAIRAVIRQLDEYLDAANKEGGS